jgi:HD-GYP domain-containing protein (c-di-GMP phosphodiesterase class II)
LNPTTEGVLIFAAVTTLWLIYYVKVYLPNQLESRFLESMKAFSKAIELRFPANSGRTEEIIRLARAAGRRFGYTRSELLELELAAHLRDIGCCAIPYHPFNDKPRLEWNEAEEKVFNKHPEVSGAMLELVPSLRHVADSVRWHHARYDGKNVMGSPVGPDLPLNARILKVASDFAWMSYEVGPGAATKMLEKGKGTEYCPEVVGEFMQVLTSSRVKEPEPSLAGF